MTIVDPEPELVLVCGSRTLGEREDTTAWARHLIECILDHAEVIVTGDAFGPDTWAREAAVRRGIPCVVYALDGRVVDGGGAELGRWCATVPGRDDPARFRWPLKRNAAMVRAVALRARREQRDAHVEGLYDPASTTRGTLHTLRLAREQGLRTHLSAFNAQQWAEQQAQDAALIAAMEGS